MSRHRLLRFETSQFRLRASKTTTNPAFSHENISTVYGNDEPQPQQENSNEFRIWHETQEFGNLNMEYNDNFESEPNNDSPDNLSYSDIEYDDWFCGTNSDNDTSDSEETFTKIFDETNFNLTWNPEDQFGIFENFTILAMFMWAVKYMICKYEIR